MIIPPKKGLIALDIDGTLTADKHSIPSKVIEYLQTLEREGWAFIFITGRPFEWAHMTLQALPFPFLFAVQNGAILIEMPSKNIWQSHYLTPDLIPRLESICINHHTDFVIYTGCENNDLCYYRKTHFSSEMCAYLMQRKKFLVEKWVEIASFDDLPISFFTALKSFATEVQAQQLSIEIEKQLGLHAPPIRDPFAPNYYIIQATHTLASKGRALQEVLKQSQFKRPVIAAGDDNNDYGMLQAADVKIVMANAPQKLLEIADIIAPPASENGLLQGLSQALERLNQL